MVFIDYEKAFDFVVSLSVTRNVQVTMLAEIRNASVCASREPAVYSLTATPATTRLCARVPQGTEVTPTPSAHEKVRSRNRSSAFTVLLTKFAFKISIYVSF